MTTKNNIPAGYKDSAVGVIPQEWEVKRLGLVCNFLDNQRVPIKDVDREGMRGLYPYYGASGIIDYVNDYIFDDELILLGEDGANIINRSTPLAFMVEGKIWVNNHAHVLKPIEPHNRFFICSYLESISYDKYNTGTAQPKLNREVCEKILIPVPPIEEQRKIAEILGVWDEAIEKQSRLIEKLELRKRALMQRLLTGRTRLPGFTTPWQKVKLSEIGKISSAGVDKKVNEGEVPVRLLNFADVFYRDFIYNDELTHWVTAKPIKVEQCSVQKGDIFFTPSSEMPTDIAISAVAMEDMTGVVYSYHIVRLRPHIEMDLHYRAYAFKTDEFYKQAERICDGSGQRYVISQDGFRNMSIHLPSLPEQKAIAEVLTTADKEIATHRKKLYALRLQKRGLMQQLLTGKTRVKI